MNIDDILEQIASDMERKTFTDLRGIMGRRKRDREDADLRMQARQEQRRELADWVRSFKAGRGNSYPVKLERILDNPFARGADVAAALVMGHAELTISFAFGLGTHTANVRPVFRITLTEDGLAVLEQNKTKTETE